MLGPYNPFSPPYLIQDRALPEEPRTVHAPERLLVRVDAQVLRQVGLLPEALATLRARVRPGLDVYAAVLQQRALLLELLLADRAAHVQRHTGRPAVLDHIRQHRLAARRLVQILQIVAEDGVVHALAVLEVGRIVVGREAAARLAAALGRLVAERLLVLRLGVLQLGRVRHVLGPERRMRTVLEDQMRRHICLGGRARNEKRHP